MKLGREVPHTLCSLWLHVGLYGELRFWLQAHSPGSETQVTRRLGGVGLSSRRLVFEGFRLPVWLSKICKAHNSVNLVVE